MSITETYLLTDSLLAVQREVKSRLKKRVEK